MDGFEVEPATLRSAASQIEATGGQVIGTASGVPATAQGAVAANPGYALSAALADFTQQLSSSIAAAGQAVTRHGTNLGTAADAYERGDEANAALFQ